MLTEDRYEVESLKTSSIERALIKAIMVYLRKFEKPEEGFNFVEEAMNNISHFLHINYDRIITELKEEKCKQTCSIS